MDEGNKDVPTDGDKAIDQEVEPDTGVYKATEAVDVDYDSVEAGKEAYEQFLGNLDLTTIPPQPITPKGVTLTPAKKDGGGMPTRDRKPISRLVPSFKGKSNGTAMVQLNAEMVGMIYGERNAVDGN